MSAVDPAVAAVAELARLIADIERPGRRAFIALNLDGAAPMVDLELDLKWLAGKTESSVFTPAELAAIREQAAIALGLLPTASDGFIETARAAIKTIRAEANGGPR